VFTLDWFLDSGVRILAILAIGAIIYFVLRRLIPGMVKRSVVHRRKGHLTGEAKKRVDTLSSALNHGLAIIIVVVALVTILPEFGVNIGALLAGLGVVGIAVGFGAQITIQDLIAGFFILIEDQYRVGDVVKIADIGGLVEKISIRRTILRDLDGVIHSVPNSLIKVASNLTKGYSRVNLNVSVAYGENLDYVIQVINRVCDEMAADPQWGPLIVKKPQVLRVDKLGDSGVDIKILGDTKPIRQWEVTGELRLRLKREFDREGIEIPWPHTKVYFGNALPGTIKDQK